MATTHARCTTKTLSVRRKKTVQSALLQKVAAQNLGRRQVACDVSFAAKELVIVANGRPQHHDNDNMTVITIILARHYRALVHD